MTYLYYKAINWNETEDEIDQLIWERLTENFWLDTRIPMTEDQVSWNELKNEEQEHIGNMLAAAALVASYQSEKATYTLRPGCRTQQEEAVLNIIGFMESVHAKGYTTIFRALVNDDTAAEFYAWAESNHYVQQKINILQDIYRDGTDLQRRIAFILSETQLVYSQFYTVLLLEELPNVNRMLDNILSGSHIFLDYIGYKFRRSFEELSESDRIELIKWTNQISQELFHNEFAFLDEHYLGNIKDPLEFVQFGINQAYEALGFEKYYDTVSDSPAIHKVKQLAQTVKNNDYRSKALISTVFEPMTNDDYDF